MQVPSKFVLLIIRYVVFSKPKSVSVLIGPNARCKRDGWLNR
jgi:hypothetical protein